MWWTAYQIEAYERTGVEERRWQVVDSKQFLTTFKVGAFVCARGNVTGGNSRGEVDIKVICTGGVWAWAQCRDDAPSSDREVLRLGLPDATAAYGTVTVSCETRWIPDAPKPSARTTWRHL